jgi:hypothetical protein
MEKTTKFWEMEICVGSFLTLFVFSLLSCFRGEFAAEKCKEFVLGQERPNDALFHTRWSAHE